MFKALNVLNVDLDVIFINPNAFCEFNISMVEMMALIINIERIWN